MRIKSIPMEKEFKDQLLDAMRLIKVLILDSDKYSEKDKNSIRSKISAIAEKCNMTKDFEEIGVIQK